MKRSTLALCSALVFGSSGWASAATLPLELDNAQIWANGGLGSAILSESTATWTYDTATGVVTGSGRYVAQYQVATTLPGQLFTHVIEDLQVGGGNAASATSYECIEGSFGAAVGGHLCGNINFGQNGTFDSLVSYGPGNAFSRTILPDDFSEGPQQNLSRYDGMITNFDGSLVVLNRPDPFTLDPVLGSYRMTFRVVPAPAAAWLFVSALGALGWVRGTTSQPRE